jgi:hypothetical protein
MEDFRRQEGNASRCVAEGVHSPGRGPSRSASADVLRRSRPAAVLRYARARARVWEDE